MADCVTFSYDTQQDGKTYRVFELTDTSLSDCSDFVTQSSIEYKELLFAAGQMHSDALLASVINPVDLGESFGIGFGLVVTISVLAYKIKVALRTIKLA